MNSNRVYSEKQKKVLFRANNLQDCVDWMIEHKDDLEPIGTFADEVDENDNVLGWWELQDLIDEGVIE